MLTKSPCELYTKYLVTHPDGYTNDQITYVLDQYQLDFIGESYYRRLRDACIPPEPFYPRDLKHQASQAFLIEQELFDLYHLDDDMRGAFRILESARTKAYVECLLMADAPSADLARFISTRCRIGSVTAGAIRKYEKYFWNIYLLDQVQLMVVLNIRTRAIERSSDPFLRDIANVFRREARNDPRRKMARMPVDPSSAHLALYHMGIPVKTVKTSEAMDNCSDMVAIRLRTVLQEGAPNYDVHALNLTKTMAQLQEILANMARPEEELRKQLATLSLENDSKPLPLIHDLSRGNHTTDLMTMPKQEEGQDDDEK